MSSYECRIGNLGNCQRQSAETCWNCPDRVPRQHGGKRKKASLNLSLGKWKLLDLLMEKGEVVKTQKLGKELGWSGALVGRLMSMLARMGFTTRVGSSRWEVDKGKLERLSEVVCIEDCKGCIYWTDDGCGV